MQTLNSQRKALIWWHGQKEQITDGRKPEITVMMLLSVANCSLITPITPQTCHAKSETQINSRWTLPASFTLVGCLPQATWPERFFSRKSGCCSAAAD